MSGPASSGLGIGILAIGAYLPPEVRTNDWWRPEIVAGWMERRARQLAALRDAPPPETPAMARVIHAMAEVAGDPFQGSVERHILAAEATAYDMEEVAARDALGRAGVALADIDLVFTHTLVPELMINNSACVLHHRLGLGPQCFVMGTDATAFSFLAQLTVAEQMIASGRARNALLVQSCAVTRLIPPEDPVAPLFGDGATAVVLGRVSADRGIIRAVHRTTTPHPFWMGAGARSGRWYDEGRAVLYCPDPNGASHVFLDIPDQAKQAVDAVLDGTQHTSGDVAFFAAHQGMPWLRVLTQEHAGLGTARTLDTFPFAASLFSANIPLVLRHADERGLLRDGDLTLLFGGGTGVTFGATLVRWGR
jgi:3-oxoacyl-[acyl-carrier-protein] synthase-3